MKMSQKIAELQQQVDELSFAVERLTQMVTKVMNEQTSMTDALTIKALRKLEIDDD